MVIHQNQNSGQNSDLLQTFCNEAETVFDTLEDLLGSLGSNPQDTELLNALFRNAHNLKGAAHVVGLSRVAETAHVVEELLSRWRNGKLKVNQPQIEWATASLQLLRHELNVALYGDEEEQQNGTAGAASGKKQTYIRTSLKQLDGLLDLFAELVIRRSKEKLLYLQLSRDSSNTHNNNFRDMLTTQEQFDSILLDLRKQLVNIRLVPMKPLFAQLRKSAMQVASQIGKKIEIEMSGEELEIDTTIADQIKDPLNHMIRNAVDHGIESPHIRRENGKSDVGRIFLHATQDGGDMIITLGDDGGGLNRQRILNKAKSLGLPIPEDGKYAKLIFAPGFSTASQVTNISGRGVGMDVVRQNIESLRGTIDIDTEEGVFTEFTIKIPLSLSITDGFMFESSGQKFIIPDHIVDSCTKGSLLQHSDIQQFDAPTDVPKKRVLSVVHLNGQAVPCVGLDTYFQHITPPTRYETTETGETIASNTDAHQDRKSILVIRNGSERVGLVVDRVYGKEQFVVKPLGPMFQKFKNISGASVLGDGSIALLLEIGAIMYDIKSRQNEYLQLEQAA